MTSSATHVPVTDVLTLVWPCVSAVAVLHIVVELALVTGAVGPGHDALTVTFVVEPAALVNRAILVLHRTLSVLSVVSPRT